MTPKEYKQMMDYLTRSSIKDKVKFASDITKPDPKPIVEEIELFNEFNKRNPMANGGLSSRGSKQVFTKKGKKTSEILKEKRVLGKDMLKYLEARFPKIKDYEKFYRNASKDDVANWKKAAPTYVEIQKIPNIEKAGKYPFGTKAVGGYVEKVKLIKQFNELKPTYKTMGKGTGAKGFSERPFTLDEWLDAGPERRKIGRMSKEEYLNYRNVAKGKIKEFKKKKRKD